MNKTAQNKTENTSRATANDVAFKNGQTEPVFEDNRPVYTVNSVLTNPINPVQQKKVSPYAHITRALTTQLAEDMALAKAKLIHQIRQDTYAALWTGGAKNSEIQVSVEGTVAVVGWNIGGSLRVNAPPSVDDIPGTLATVLSDNSDAYDALLNNGGTAITKIDFIRTKQRNAAEVEGRSIHAEGIIIAERIKGMLDLIKAGEELQPVSMSVFGKKAACKQCGNTISRINGDTGIARFLEIQIAADDIFEDATGDRATHGSQKSKWINPLHLIQDEINAAHDKMKGQGPFGHGLADGLNWDKLLPFLEGLKKEAAIENPE